MDASLRLTHLVQAGIELVKMVHQTTGPEAAQLLTGSLAAGAGGGRADGSSADGGEHQPTDVPRVWQAALERVAPSPQQLTALTQWRMRWLHRIDEVYGRRLLLKAQVCGGAADGPAE